MCDCDMVRRRACGWRFAFAAAAGIRVKIFFHRFLVRRNFCRVFSLLSAANPNRILSFPPLRTHTAPDIPPDQRIQQALQKAREIKAQREQRQGKEYTEDELKVLMGFDGVGLFPWF